MIEVDRLMIEEYGIQLLQMMENAGRALAAVARHLLGGTASSRRVVVLAGRGNNGGGGLVATRHLANAGAEVALALSAGPGELGEAAEHQRRTLSRMGVEGSDQTNDVVRLAPLLARADLVVDALIGYSLKGAPRAPIASLIRAANAVGTPMLALDLPSGLDGDLGAPREPTIRARATLTLAWPKAGLLSRDAAEFVGALYLADIGVPAGVYRAVGLAPGDVFAGGPIVRVVPTAGGWAPIDDPGVSL